MLQSLCLIWLLLASAKGASDKDLLKDTCTRYDSCGETDFYRTCSCDDDCFAYGTCCHDAEGWSSMSKGNLEFYCHTENIVTPVYAKKTCAPDFQGDENIRRACTKGGWGPNDLVMNTLVTSTATKTTYQNWNCAICNHEQPDDISYWKIIALCPSRYGNTTIEDLFIKQNIVYDKQKSNWGLFFDDDFIKCTMILAQPAAVTGLLRYCPPDMVSSCPPDYPDVGVRKKCISNYGERQQRGTRRYFKNMYCALCNGVDRKELDCFGRNYRPNLYGSSSNTVKASFEKDDWEKTIGLYILKCRTKDMVYDDRYEKCRFLPKFSWWPKNSATSKSPTSLFMILLVILISIRNKFPIINYS